MFERFLICRLFVSVNFTKSYELYKLKRKTVLSVFLVSVISVL